MLQDLRVSGARVKQNLSPAELYEEAVRRREGVIAEGGPLACRTGQHTGRSPNDKFVALRRDFMASLNGAELFVQDCAAGADLQYRLPIRIITEYAWHGLFARNLFIVDPD